MRILIVTQYFYPENFKSNDIAFEMVKKGHQVDVLCGIPNYPQGKYYKGHGVFSKRKENIKGVNVYRSFQFPRGKGGRLRLMVNYLSYVISASLYILFFFSFKKYDCTIVHEVSPIFQAYPALLLKKIKKIPMYLWVLDLWPDAMMSGGGIKNKSLLSFVNKLVCNIYRHSDKILISSRRFRDSITTKGDFDKKIEYFPNWSDDMLFPLKKTVNSIPQLPSGFKIMLAGNLGKSQNLEAVMETILELRNISNLKWLFLGDGTKKKWLDDFIEENDLKGTVSAMGRYPADMMPAFFEKADALLLTLKSGFPHLKMVVPARLQTYMSSAKPILGMIDGGAVDIIKEAKCGFTVPAGDSKALAETIKQKVLTDLETWSDMGKNGRKYYTNNFTKEICINNLEKILIKITK